MNDIISPYITKGHTIHTSMLVELSSTAISNIMPIPNFFRAILISAGSGLIIINGIRALVEAPSILCLNGTEDVNLIKSESLELHCIYFNPTVINVQFSRDFFFNPQLHQFDDPISWDIYLLDPFMGSRDHQACVKIRPSAMDHLLHLRNLLEECLKKQTDCYWPCRSRSYFLEILFAIRNAMDKKEANVPSLIGLPSRMEDILLYMHSHYQEDLSINFLCERFAINRTSLNELFQKYAGTTVIQYLINLRIRIASLLLRDTTVPIKELAFRTGFNDLVNFTRTFKRSTNFTPSQYRKEYCAMLA